ncbi:MAG: hypothetical protein R6U61_03845 [Thermoplasmata archaeon]
MVRKISALLTALLVVSFLVSSPVYSQVTEVSDPGKANKILSDFSTPIIRPSQSGKLSFNITNLYDGDFTNIVFTTEIYGYANLDMEKEISKVTKPPTFKSSGGTSTSFSLNVLTSNDTYTNEYTIMTNEDTEKGVYFVRFAIEFVYEPTGNLSVMRSRGYFTDSEWENATKRPGVPDEPYYSGSINITALGVNGILPDTSFSVKTPIPQWPKYMLGGFAAFFGILAVMLYMQEEYNSFPWLEEILNQWSGKFKQFRRRLENRLGKR